MAVTKIEWTMTRLPDGSMLPGYTFNPWYGCTKVSGACDHCYAEAWAKRSGLVEWGNHPRRRTSPNYWRQPFGWDRRAERDGVRRKVFCASLADVFDNQADPAWRKDLFGLIRLTPALDWLLLTKRPQNIEKMVAASDVLGRVPNNVWLGTTVENQEEADRRIQHLLATPAAVRFLSVEPMLGPVDLAGSYCPKPAGWRDGDKGISWVICGGESGPGARPMEPDWPYDLQHQCFVSGVPFFFKQWGEWAPANEFASETQEDYDVRGLSTDRMVRVGKRRAGALLNGHEWREFPDAR